MSFFWPTAPDLAPSGVGRLGRVCHWVALLSAAALIVAGMFGSIADSDPAPFWICLGIGLVWAQIGRGLRYILAGE